MAPSAIDQPAATASTVAKTYPPATIFPVKETRFEKFIEPQEDGRKRALEHSGDAALVIDNGNSSDSC
jgi:actin-related protein 5